MEKLQTLLIVLLLHVTVSTVAQTPFGVTHSYYQRLLPVADDSISAFQPLAQLGIGGFNQGDFDVANQLAIGAEYRNTNGRSAWQVGLLYRHQTMPSFQTCDCLVPAQMASQSQWSAGSINWLDVQWGYQFRVTEDIQLKAGFGRDHWGSGIRSFWLSDQNLPSTYAGLTAEAGPLAFEARYLFLDDESNFNEFGWNTKIGKYAALHQVSLDITQKLKYTFFEAIVWNREPNRGFDPTYLNPLAFYRPMEFSIGSTDNALMGAELTYQWNDQFSTYATAVIDEFLFFHLIDRTGWWANKFGTQLGVKWSAPFGWESIVVQSEVNIVRPYTYSHALPVQSYSHGGQALAHPYGANFAEWIWIGGYAKGLWNVKSTLSGGRIGFDDGGVNYGQNILLDNGSHFQTFGNQVGQGASTDFVQFHLDVSRSFQKKKSLQLYSEVHTVRLMGESGQFDSWSLITAGVRMNLGARPINGL